MQKYKEYKDLEGYPTPNIEIAFQQINKLTGASHIKKIAAQNCAATE